MADVFDWGLLEPAGAEPSPVSDDRVLEAMVAVEEGLAHAWDGLDAASTPLVFDAGRIDRGRLVAGAREAGVPVMALVQQLRGQAGAQADRVHRGATSQDIVDTALVLVSRDALASAREDLKAAAAGLASRAQHLRAVPMMARTLTQQAEPTALGAVLASWLDVVVSAWEALDSTSFPVQLGGAVGTGAAFSQLARRADATEVLRGSFASRLGLDDPGRAWHTDRSPVLAIAGSAASVAAAAGRVGRDLGLAARDGALLPATGGGSSAMPHKRNPVDAVLLVANGLRAPGLLATLHTAALSYDGRPAGEWHAEWQPWRSLLRIAVESASMLSHAVVDLTVARATPPSLGVAAGEEDLAAAERLVDMALARHERKAAR